MTDENRFSPSPGQEAIRDYCPTCEMPIEPDWSHCGYCGKAITLPEKIREMEIPFDSPRVPGNGPGYSKSRVFSGKYPRIFLIGGSVVIGLIVIGSLFLLRNGPFNNQFLSGAGLPPSPPPEPSGRDENRSESSAGIIGTPTFFPTAIPASNSTPSSTQTSALTSTQSSVSTPMNIPVAPDVQAKADQYFAKGAALYIFDPHPTAVPLSSLENTIFTFRYILSSEAKKVPNLIFILRVNSTGTKEYQITEGIKDEDWAIQSGSLSFSLSSPFRVTYRQGSEHDPTKGVLQGFVGLTSVYGGMNEFFVDDPIYLDVALVAPVEQDGTLYLFKDTTTLSNTLRIEVTH